MASIKPKRTAPTVGTLAPILPLLLLRYTSATAQNVSNSKTPGLGKEEAGETGNDQTLARFRSSTARFERV